MEAAPVLRRIAKRFPLHERECAFLGPMEAGEMLALLDDPATPDAERASIGDRLSLLPGGDPRPGVGVAEDGLPNILWCDIPGGEVTLVTGDKPGPSFPVEPFRMAKYPITVAQWRVFLEDPEGYDARIRQRYNGVAPALQRGGDNQPAVNIAWIEAMAYCEWLGERLALVAGLTIRLPAEWEWQQAACSGHADWAYPWGPDWVNGHTNTIENGLGRMVGVGLYPAGESAQGARDLAGNAWDWCLNEYGNPERTGPGGSESRVLRGGSWDYDRDGARADNRNGTRPDLRLNYVGFRVLSASPIC